MLNFKKTSRCRSNYTSNVISFAAFKVNFTESTLFNVINLTLSLHQRGSSKVSPLQFLSLYICSLWLSVPVRIHTVQIFIINIFLAKTF